MTWQPLTVLEWLGSIAGDPGRIGDFAREAIETLETDCTPAYWEMREDLENIAGCKFQLDRQIIGFVEHRHSCLADIEEKISALNLEFPEHVKGTDAQVGEIINLWLAAENELARLKAPAIVLPDGTPLEYDL